MYAQKHYIGTPKSDADTNLGFAGRKKFFFIFFKYPLKTLYNFTVMKYNEDTLAS